MLIHSGYIAFAVINRLISYIVGILAAFKLKSGMDGMDGMEGMNVHNLS